MFCSVEGCKNYVQHAGRCNLHYRRTRRASEERKRNWSADEKALVTTLYRERGPRGLAVMLNRTEKAVRIQARVLGVQNKREKKLTASDPQVGTMVGSALRMWKGPVDPAPLRWAA